ncbi:MAG TPA: hypothetical protein VGD65_16430 [Chryseosolibacter sp.]
MLASEIQERKNRKSLIVLVVLVVATVAAFFVVRQKNRVTVDKNFFRTVDLESIDKIRIENLRDTIELTFENSRWRVNNRYPADRSLVTLFFATLKQAEPKREMTAGITDSVRASASNVVLYSGAEVVQNFVAFGNASRTQSFFQDPKSGRNFLMTIPGYRVYVSGIFELTTGGWRDKMVFGTFNWRNFQSLEARFPDKPGESFKVQPAGDGLFGIEGIKTDTAKLNTFLDDVSLISVEDYPESLKLRDSLTQVKPFLNLIVTDIANKQQTLSIYRENETGVLGLSMGEDPVIFNAQRIRNIIRPKSFFVQK